jgi:dihydroneopterin triphosphate diphosphatase
MPSIVSDIIDAYLFRRANARVQFLVLRRKPELPMGDTWQAVHGKIEAGETALDAVKRETQQRTGLLPIRLYSADYIGQFYDHESDTIVLAPTFAVQVAPRAKPNVSAEYVDYAWCDLEETTARLMWTSQRWAVRHIYDVIAMGGDESEMYAL